MNQVDISDFILFNSRFRLVLKEVDDNPFKHETVLQAMEKYLSTITEELLRLATDTDRVKVLVESMAHNEIFTFLGKIGLFQLPQGAFNKQIQFVNVIMDYIFDEIIILGPTNVANQISRYLGYLLIDINNYLNEGLFLPDVMNSLEKILYVYLNYPELITEWVKIVNHNCFLVEKQILKTDMSVLGLGSVLESGLSWKLIPIYSICRNHLSVTNDCKFYDIFLELVKKLADLSNWCVNSGEFTLFLTERTLGFLDVSLEVTMNWIKTLMAIIHKTPENLKPMLLYDIIEMLDKLYFSQDHKKLVFLLKQFLQYDLDGLLIEYLKTFISHPLTEIVPEDGNDLDLIRCVLDNGNLELILPLFCHIRRTSQEFNDPRLEAMSSHMFSFDEDLVISEFSDQLVMFKNFERYFIIRSDLYLVYQLLNYLVRFFINDPELNVQLILLFQKIGLCCNGTISIFNEDFIIIIQYLYQSFQWYSNLLSSNTDKYFMFSPTEEIVNNLTFVVKLDENIIIDKQDLIMNLYHFQKFYINTYVNLKLKQRYKIQPSNA